MNPNSASHVQQSPINQILEYQKTKCPEIATELLIRYQPMVKMAAGKISKNRPDLFEDLYQVGQMALLRLFEQFDSMLGIQFEPYAMKSLIGHMKNYLRDKSWYIQVPRRIKEKGTQVQRAIDELTNLLERSPEIPEIANHLELSVEETIEILSSRDYYHYVSLDTPFTADDRSATIGELIGSPTDEYEDAINRMDLQEAMAHLKDEERRVLELAFEVGHSQRTIADELGISQMSVSRIQQRAIAKLQRIMGVNDKNMNITDSNQ
jgi:RNA polymerase sigma-B factor